MNYAVYNITLDIHKMGSQVALSMIRGENKRKIVISLTENGRPYKIADGTDVELGYFTALKPDDNFIYNGCEIDKENNQIVYYVTSQTTAAVGEVKCQVKLFDNDGGLLFTPQFSIIVADTLYNEEPIVASSEEFNALTKYIADLEYRAKHTDEFKGDKGDKGDTGEQGPQGIQGIQGERGLQGVQGVKGDVGPQGEKGEKGDRGQQGKQGIQGEQGIQGVQGEKGEKGDAGQVDYSLVANALKGNKSGETVTLDDISPLEHTLGVNVRSKNILHYPFIDKTMTTNGITFTDNGDGTITANGTATADAIFNADTYTFKANQNYFISGCPKGGSISTYYLQAKGYNQDFGNGRLIESKKEFSNKAQIVIKSGVTVSNLVFKPQFEIGETATEFCKYVDVSKVSVICGNENYPVNADGTVEGIKSIYPITTLETDTECATITAEYNKDINKLANDFNADMENLYNTKADTTYVDSKVSDIGSSGENWRTIQHLTLTEDTNSIVFSTDSEGNPFNLKKARLIIKGTATHARLNTWINNGEYSNPYFYTALIANKAANLVLDIGEATNGLRVVRTVTNEIGGSYLLNGPNFVIVTPNKYGKNTPINHFRFTCDSSGYFLSGTEFIFEGVDE